MRKGDHDLPDGASSGSTPTSRRLPPGDPTGEGGAALQRAFPRFADDLAWWAQAAREQRARTDVSVAEENDRRLPR